MARSKGLVIENPPAVREIHTALIEGRRVQVVDPGGWIRESLSPYEGAHLLVETTLERALALGDPCVYVGSKELGWPEGWLRLRPKELVAGVGCHRGTPSREILMLIRETFKQEGLSLLALRALATIEGRRKEHGLLETARALGVDLIWFSAKELVEMTVPHPSKLVVRHMGTVSVCEASALRAVGTGQLVVPKRKSKRVTLAVARADSPSSVSGQGPYPT
jgi:cobalt-precorrin 5A hydrolase